MNQLDELVLAFEGRDPAAQKYLLSAMGRQSPGLGGVRVVDLLWNQSGATDPAIRHQARRELGRVMPRHLVQDYGLELSRALGGAGEGVAHLTLQPDRGGAPSPAFVQALGAAFHRLTPAIDETLRLLDEGSARVRHFASLLVGRFPLRSTVTRLTPRFSSGDVSFGHVAALSEMGIAESQELLAVTASSWGLKNADLAMLLAAIPTDRSLPILVGLEPRTDAMGRANIAQALSHDNGSQGRYLLEKIIRRGEGWVTAYALDAIKDTPRAEDLALVRLALEGEKNEYVRAMAVRLAGNLPGDDVLPFIEEALADSSPRIQGAALEAFMRKGGDNERLGAAALELLPSTLLKTRVTAMLVLTRIDPDRVVDEVQALLFADRPIERLEGAYILGYLSGSDSGAVLQEMGASDPVGAVRLQAVKSLARLPTKESLDPLIGLASDPDPEVSVLASQALAGVESRSLDPVHEVLVRLAKASTDITLRTAFLRSIAMVSARRPAPTTPAIVVDHLAAPQPALLAGALDALKVVGSPTLGEAIRPQLGHSDARVKAAAAVTGFWCAEAGATGALTDLLRSGRDEIVLVGLNALMRVVSVLPAALASPRFASLCAQLTESAGRPDVAAYVEAEISSLKGEKAPDSSGVLSRDSLGLGSRRKTGKPGYLRPTLQRLKVLYTQSGKKASLEGDRPAQIPAEVTLDPARSVPSALLRDRFRMVAAVLAVAIAVAIGFILARCVR